MKQLLWLVPAFPFAGYVVLALRGSRFPRRVAAWIGTASIGLSALTTLLIGGWFLSTPPSGHAWVQYLWTWLSSEDFTSALALRLDPLSLIMILVVTVVGFFIHLYSVEYMAEETEGYSRFFAYMNLFVGSMLVLVLADNLLLLYLGWEGVGLCSYLLIGFWYRDPANGQAARKAFIVTRVGDTALIIALFLLYTRLGTLDIQALLSKAQEIWPAGSPVAMWAAILLLGGAVGKSAQLPLQTWLPDAMAGPTPVSALIHAATMVTAGVYLIARTNAIFLLAPPVLTALAVIGALTLLLAGVSACVQTDIKRVLAYSTISQIGYMFLALGVGAFSAAIFHFFTHAFFKALLFLAAGAVILSVRHEQDLRKMGGLRKEIPLVFWTFLIGGASLCGVPLVTAGFYSKDLILWEAWSSERGGTLLWAAGFVGVLLTSLYTFRLIFLAFYGPRGTPVHTRPGPAIRIPLVVLAVFSVIAGWIEFPRSLGGHPLLTQFLESILPGTSERGNAALELSFQVLTAGVVAIGIRIAWTWFVRRPQVVPEGVRRFWQTGWGFDRLYEVLFVRPFEVIAQAIRKDPLDLPSAFVARVVRGAHFALRPTQTGRIRWYAAAIAAGAVFLIAVVVFL